MKCPSCKRDVVKLVLLEGTWGCLDCQRPQAVLAVSGAMFPFTTRHLGGDGKPVEVRSLRHLRQLEARHGVHSVAFNQDSRNFGAAPRSVENPQRRAGRG